MDDDELYVERVDEDRLVDFFLDAEDDEDDARYACYNPANPGCNEDSPIVITRRDWFDEEDEDGERYLPKGKVLGYEEYWFEMPGSFSAFR